MLHGFARSGLRFGLMILLAGLMAGTSSASYENLENEVQEILLDNGLRILLIERHDVPVFSFTTYVNVGGVDETGGKTGLAHMFEHMAFKGTRELGTFDYEKEARVLRQMDDVYEKIQAEKLKYAYADQDKLVGLEAEFTTLREEADRLVDSNAFGKLVEGNGGVGMNAYTSADATVYYYSLPSSKLELWALLESDRFIQPVLREFYKERNVIIEERRMRTESQPQGRLIEEWFALAFLGHPYGQPTIGHRSDIEGYSRRDAQEFYARHYGARNMIIAVVGDVYREDLESLAHKYFAKIPAGSGGEPVRTLEPEQLGERRVVIEETSQPFIAIGYHVPEARHQDASALSALADILGQGRSSRLNTRLVKEQQLALFAGSFSGLPGQRYPALLSIFALPNKDVSPAELEEAVYAEVDRIIADGVTADELAGAKTRARAQFIKGLEGNRALATQLCWAQMALGGWRELFHYVEKLEQVTVEDVQRVAAEYLTKSNRTVGMIVTGDSASEGKGDAS